MAHNSRVRVAVDAMGGDYAPEEIVKGVVLAAQSDDVEIFLVGSGSILEKELAKHGLFRGSSVHVIEAGTVIKEDESPIVYRPAIVGCLGSFAPNTVMVDLGANVDCKPHQFLTFAIAGSVYAKKFLNIPDPKIALLSTGREETKGSGAVREAYPLLKESGLNFIGNIEGNDILSGKANVIVCDGFYESFGGHARDWTVRKLKKHPPLSALVRLAFNRLFDATKISSETDKQGGGILWGVDGVVRIAHGASRAPHIANAVESAKKAVRADVIQSLKSELAELNQGGKS
jgi:glycerol-3-phosphate acyltransferase PlsX